MRETKAISTWWLAAFIAITVVLSLQAQGQDTFKGRLAPVPVDAKTAPDTTGRGAASAVLAGSKLTVTGTFEGLRGAATTAQLRRGAAAGVRGPAMFDLTVSKATSGAISGSFDLSADQVESLRSGKIYVQIHSEKAPEGNLWGWLLK
jgi:hypothetical protein